MASRLATVQSFASRNKRGLIIGGVSGGLVAAIIGGFFALLPLKLVHLFKNIEAKRMGIEQHVFDRRSDAWSRAYLKARASGNEDAYFRAKRIDTNHPFRDWYNTLKLNGFEDRLTKNQGIIFRADANNGGKLVRLEIPSENRNYDLSDPAKLDATVAEIFDTDKGARQAIRDAVKEETRWYQVLKRRHMRTWMQNTLGVRKWRVFEGTRDKANASVRARYSKFILEPVHSHFGQWITCILAKTSSCPKTSSLNDPENSVGGQNSGGREIDSAETDQDSSKDPADVKKVDAESKVEGSKFGEQLQEAASVAESKLTDVSADIEGRVAQVASEAAAATTEEAKAFVPSSMWEAVLGETIASKVAGPAAAIGILDQLDHANSAISSNKLGKIAAVSRATQYAAAFAAFAITVDHFKSGQNVSGEEVNAMMQKVDGIESAQGYTDTTGGVCSDDCTKAQPVNNSSLDNVAKDWNASATGSVVGKVLGAYHQIRHLPVIGSIVDFAFTLGGKLVGVIQDAAFAAIKAGTGGAVDISKLISKLMIKVVTLVAGVVCDGSDNGAKFYNCVDAGALVSASSFMQSSGGHVLTPGQVVAIRGQIASDQTLAAARLPFWQRISSLNNPTSLASRSLSLIPTSPRTALRQIGGYMATMLTNPLRLAGSGSMTVARAMSGAATADSGTNIYGIKEYGFTDAELDADPLDPALNGKSCAEVAADWRAKLASGDEKLADNSSSLAMLDCTFASSSKSMLTTDDDGGLGDGVSGVASVSNATIPPLTATRQELNQRLLSNPLLKDNRVGDVTGDIKNGVASDALVQLMVNIVEVGKLPLQANVIKTGHDDCSASGFTSNHYSGLALDIQGFTDPSTVKLQSWLFQNAASLGIDELIHEPHPAGVSDLKNGQTFNYDAKTQSGHFNHIHVSIRGRKLYAGCPRDPRNLKGAQ